MPVDQIQGTGFQNQQKSNPADFSKTLLKKAEQFGITIPYKEDGSIDIVTLQSEINKHKREESTQTVSSSKADEFVTTNAGIKDTVENTKKAENYKNTISSEYKNEAAKYKQYMNFNAGTTTQETELEKLWNEVKESEFRLTKTGTTNQTVIEGLSSFIQKLTGVVEATKNYEASNENADKKESAFSIETQQDIQNTKNKIEAHEAEAEDNILGNNPFMKSAFETSEYEYEEMAV